MTGPSTSKGLGGAADRAAEPSAGSLSDVDASPGSSSRLALHGQVRGGLSGGTASSSRVDLVALKSCGAAAVVATAPDTNKAASAAISNPRSPIAVRRPARAPVRLDDRSSWRRTTRVSSGMAFDSPRPGHRWRPARCACSCSSSSGSAPRWRGTRTTDTSRGGLARCAARARATATSAGECGAFPAAKTTTDSNSSCALSG